MLIVFIAATFSAMARGLDIDCGCTGQQGSTNPWEIIIRNTAFLALLGVDMYVQRRWRRKALPAELLASPSAS